MFLTLNCISLVRRPGSKNTILLSKILHTRKHFYYLRACGISMWFAMASKAAVAAGYSGSPIHSAIALMLSPPVLSTFSGFTIKP